MSISEAPGMFSIMGFIKRRMPQRLMRRLRAVRARKSLKLGMGSFVHRSAQILGLANVDIGANSCVGEFCWLNVNHRQASMIAIRIGNNCWIGRGNFFSSGKYIEIGDYCLTAIGCRFISSSHVVENPMTPYLMTGTTSHQTIRIGVNCFFGAGATVLGNVTIGHGSVIAANAMVLHNVPPFSIVAGNPAQVVKRFSFAKNAWCEVADPAVDFEAHPDEAAYLQLLKAKHGDVPMPWVAAGHDLGSI